MADSAKGRIDTIASYVALLISVGSILYGAGVLGSDVRHNASAITASEARLDNLRADMVLVSNDLSAIKEKSAFNAQQLKYANDKLDMLIQRMIDEKKPQK